MILKFYAREDLLVNDPAVQARDNTAVTRVGRKFKRAKRDSSGAVVEPASYEASKDPHCVESESPAGQRLAKKCRQRSLWAADEATAKYCNVEFIKTKFVDGAHAADLSPAKAEKAPLKHA